MPRVFANAPASSTLNGAIGPADTTCTLASGQGARFPSTSGGNTFNLTFRPAIPGAAVEIVLVTGRTGDNITSMVRGQEGTTAQSWLAGDLAANLITAGALNTLLQPDQIQNGTYTKAITSGTATAIVGTLNSTMTSIPDGMKVEFIANFANFFSPTFQLILGATVTPAYNIVKYGDVFLPPGDIPAAGYPVQLTYSATLSKWIMENPAFPASPLPQKYSNHALDTGSGNLYVATYTPQLGTFVPDGTQIRFTPSFTNTGPASIDTDAWGTNPIFAISGAQLTGGEIVIGSPVEITWSTFRNGWILSTTPGAGTGNIDSSFSSAIPPGWIRYDNGTIGNSGSGASNRANVDTQALYTRLYNTFLDAVCPVSGGRGASAAADFAALKTLTLPPGAPTPPTSYVFQVIKL